MSFLPNRFHRTRRALPPIGMAASLALLLAVGTPFSSHATIRNVPASYATPQAAVAAAANGDTVLIAPGTYLGGIFVENKALVIGSWFLTTGDTTYIAQTILDTVMTNPCPGGGCAGDAVIEFDKAHNSKVVGLTIQRGKDGVRWTNQSGGVPMRVDVEWCHLFYNEDGVDVQNGGRGTLSNSLFAYSTDDGLDLNHGVDLTIINNTITENADDGIEFRLYTYSGPLLTVSILNNKFIHNDSDGIQLIDDVDTISVSRYIDIRNNLFVNNRKATVGCMPNLQTNEDYSGAPSVEKIHFMNNTVVGDAYGVCGGANLVAINNVMKDIPGSAFRRIIAPYSIVSHNLAYNCGLVNDASNLEAGTLLTGNPLLAADYHLTTGSPARDAGVASYTWRGVDVVGIPPSGYSGSAPDLGAYELNTNSPVAVNDSYDVPKGTQINVPAPGVLGNDTDPNSDPLTTNGVISGPYHGSLALNTNGSFQYTHNNDSAPRDSFIYEVKDPDLNTARATCVLLIQQPNAAPVAVHDVILVDLNSTANGLDVLANDTDSDPGDVLSIQSLSTLGTVGTATIQGDLVEYTPPAAYAGWDFFQYTVRDIQGATSSVQVNVKVEDVTTVAVSSKVNGGSSDAEEVVSSGVMDLGSGDLEMTLDTPGEQRVGIRFPGLAVPKNAQIRKAWIQFKTDEVHSNVTNLVLRSQATDNAAVFTTTTNNITSRAVGARSVTWAPPIWNVINEVGVNQRTPNLAGVVSEVVNRSGWNSGQALAIIVSGTGRRVAKAFESDTAGAARLHVEYVTGSIPVGVGENEPALELALHGIHPSPARGPVTVDFSLAWSQRTSIELLDVAGRRMVFRDLGTPSPGRHRVELRDRLPAGLYLVRVASGAATRTAKAVVLE